MNRGRPHRRLRRANGDVLLVLCVFLPIVAYALAPPKA
jgi:hypothetical protein